ncbi:hypothetical protein FGO68_gene11414 [Halteria grandinella]|uniref:U2A'/phosphoprotein 32 family A C-terminal domain-containing protein n=1 Tax=Halteria grandinella TaxID=5974 RepID=A0A8J8SZL8_HALGN|nr:hypothetical protein FGO68_gene11414 [Halteria grandinella]
MRITAELIQKSGTTLNPISEFCIDLRGYKIPFLENLSATNDQFGTIDLTDNEIVTIEALPQLLRLRTLILTNNRITRVDSNFAESCPGLESLLLTNNKISKFEEIDKIAQTCKSLLRLSLMGNLVNQLPNYRLYVIHSIPTLRVLDFQKVSQKERIAAKKLFESDKGAQIVKEMHKEIAPAKKLAGSKRTQREEGGAGAEVEEEEARKIAELDAKIAKATSLEEVQELHKQVAQINEQ